MYKGTFNDPPGSNKRHQKFGWRPAEWSEAAGCSRSYTYQLMAAKRLRTVKIGAMRIITTHPAEFLASLGDQ
jgi:hypothetical protein